MQKKEGRSLEYLQKSVSYIETHYMEDLTLEELASLVHSKQRSILQIVSGMDRNDTILLSKQMQSVKQQPDACQIFQKNQ